MKLLITLLTVLGFQTAYAQYGTATPAQTTRKAQTTKVTTPANAATPTPAATMTTTETETQTAAAPSASTTVVTPTMPTATTTGTVQSTETRTTQVASPNEVIVDDKEVLVLGEKEARTVRRGSSEFNRINKHNLVTTQVFGYGPVNGQGIGLAYGQFLDRNRLAVLEWMRNDSAKDDLTNSEDIKNFSVGAHFKKYERDFYYWKMGADYRYTSYEQNGANGGSFNADSLNVTLAAGAQWYFESFTAGVDAVGISVPLFSNFRNEKTSGTFRTSNLDDEKKKYVTDTTWVVGRVYLGVAF